MLSTAKSLADDETNAARGFQGLQRCLDVGIPGPAGRTRGGRSAPSILYMRMKAWRQFGVLILLLVSCVAPAMACMVPDAKMNTEERACCRMMKNQCGQMEMPASHGCCQKTPLGVHDNALDTKATNFHPVAAPVVWLAAFELVNPVSSVNRWVEYADSSPPKSPPATISILRI
jgi:hypothetical protein